jgi:hypothetical protein
MKVSKHGDVENASDAFQKPPFFGPFSMFLLLTMSIFSSGYLLQVHCRGEAKPGYRVIWASVDPMELLAGKILGTGCGPVASALMPACSSCLLLLCLPFSR